MLDWHNATHDHWSSLSVFRCTDPATVTFDEDRGFECHDFPWEMEVQEHLNSLRPPAHPPHFVHVGLDDEGLAAVIEMTVTPPKRNCFINALAVAHRVSGRGLAGEALDRVHAVLDSYGITGDYTVEGLVDPDNLAAKSAFGRRGYMPVASHGQYEVWAQLFDA